MTNRLKLAATPMALAVGLFTAVGLGLACSNDAGPTGPGSPQGASPFALSGPLVGPWSATSGLREGTPGASTVTFVSLPPGSIPTGTSASIQDLRTGYTVVVNLVNGGFDPVAVPAAEGDSIAISVQFLDANPNSYTRIVPATADPIVVRTDPPAHKRDVPLNAVIVIVFSEPIDPATLNGASVQVWRGSSAIPGVARFGDALNMRAEFHFDGPLAANTDYRLVVTQAIRDPNGLVLDSTVTVPFTTGSAPAQGPAGQIAFVSTGSDAVQHIYLFDVERATVTQLTSGAAPDSRPTWSPDRTRIAFQRSGGPSTAGIWLMGADGSGAVRRSALVGAPAWSPDGTELAVITGNSLWIVGASGPASERKLSDSLPGLVQYESPAWSPDGSTIAFEGTSISLGDWFTQVYVMNADGSNVRRLTSSCTAPCGTQYAEGSPNWSPDGSKLAFWSFGFGIAVANRYGGGTSSVSHDGQAIGGSAPSSGFGAHPSWSMDGQWLVFSAPYGNGQLVIGRSDGSGVMQTITGLPGGASSPAWWR